MRLLLFQNKSHPVDVYKSDPYKKGSNIVVRSFEHEGITFPHPFIFVLIPYFIGVILSKKKLAKVGGLGKRIKRGNGHLCTLSRMSISSGKQQQRSLFSKILALSYTYN